MQPYIFGDTAIIGIKVLIAPLVFRARRPFFIIPVIVDADCDYIFLSVLNIRSQDVYKRQEPYSAAKGRLSASTARSNIL